MQIPLERVLRYAQVTFIPNEQQIEAIERIADFFDGRGSFDEFVLMGYAGTGKTSIVKILLAYARLRGYYNDIEVTAPTHRAKGVISRLAGKRSNTIHKLIGLRPNVEVTELDLRDLEFNQKFAPTLPIRGILIIDEASMVQDDLHTFITEKCEDFYCRVLYIGDPAQLKPVKQKSISKVFYIEDHVELTKVERQKDGNPLGPILDAIRNNFDLSENPFTKETQLNPDGTKGIQCTSSAMEFFKYLTKDYTRLFNADPASVKMLAYTNDKVAMYNTLIRKALGIKTDRLIKGDILMAYDNIKCDQYEVWNSTDYEILEIEDGHILKEGIFMEGQHLNIRALGGNEYDLSQKVFMLDKDVNEDTLIDIGRAYEDLRQDGIRNGGRAWKPFYDFQSSFTTWQKLQYGGGVLRNRTFDFGYATTIHKSQGGTYHTVFVDDRDIDICTDREMKNQLKYVALSRPTEKAVLFS